MSSPASIERAARQVAYDRGSGSRGISHERSNPYDLQTEPTLHDSWEQGWEAADRAANRITERSSRR